MKLSQRKINREYMIWQEKSKQLLFYILSWRYRLYQISNLLVLAKVKIKGQKSEGQGNTDAGDAGNSEKRSRCHCHHSQSACNNKLSIIPPIALELDELSSNVIERACKLI